MCFKQNSSFSHKEGTTELAFPSVNECGKILTEPNIKEKTTNETDDVGWIADEFGNAAIYDEKDCIILFTKLLLTVLRIHPTPGTPRRPR